MLNIQYKPTRFFTEENNERLIFYNMSPVHYFLNNITQAISRIIKFMYHYPGFLNFLKI